MHVALAQPFQRGVEPARPIQVAQARGDRCQGRAPRDEDTLRTWAKQLGLKQGSDDWLKFFDYAAVDAGRIPDYVLKDEELVGKLPAFFRTLSGNKPSNEELENLIKLLRER